ncbi:GNAT family N-acetyltransferase [Bacillus sp. 165]|uniref:GNAT family N-acetyltransferase n=1 Tax=Bacillus sp. 165 TaxID=1529117 RepID=UPI001ADBCF55|nr:GNAT family N-acetyltransferase [Bacillus sp. 165]MBO9129104.1 GNAT family N-acetyltransferase [Bacillus sp. 165]
MILQTERLVLRKFTDEDAEKLYHLLSDKDVMTYYPSTLTKEEANKWLDNILVEYEKYGVSWWPVYTKEENAFAGQAGLLYRNFDGRNTYLLSYMLHKEYWGKGYATEISKSIIEYGLHELHIKRIDCPIRLVNTPSIRVAERLELHFSGRTDYKGYEHNIYWIDRSE